MVDFLQRFGCWLGGGGGGEVDEEGGAGCMGSPLQTVAEICIIGEKLQLFGKLAKIGNSYKLY